MKLKLIATVLFMFVWFQSMVSQQTPVLRDEQMKEDSASVNKLISKSNQYRATASFDSATQTALKASELAEKIDYLPGKAIALKTAGLATYSIGNYLETLDFWTQSLAIFQKLNDSLGIANLLNNIGALYSLQGEFPKALEYSLESLKISERIKNTLRIYSALNTIATVYYAKKSTWDTAMSYLQRALQLSEELGDSTASGIFSENIAEIYFSNGDDAKAQEFYQKSIDIGNLNNSPYAYNGIGKIYLRKGNISEALNYHKKALQIANSLDSKEHIVGSRKGLAYVYLKQQDFNSAIEQFKQAQQLAEEGSMKPELKELYEQIAKAYESQGDFKNAYSYFVKMDDVKDSLLNEASDKRIGLLQADYNLAKKQNEVIILSKDKDLQEIKIKRQRLAKNAFMIGLFLAFVIALLIYRGYRNKVKTHKILDKQKNQIEELLLNILPSQVANELQTTGHATPRHYESVSVMFTDFKGFTIIADKMSPKELVKELDDCFIAFDAIIGKYKLEKIKTIGDSYMCAGGIPTPEADHVLRMVKAGLDIQNYVSEYNEKRKERGLEPWDVRIGIHVGPVVAGVVGQRKYAYDIWGSTVNIASRMESNGEPGRVNISAATYELIKDYYVCSYRGKIYAKNVGDIDMYFIDHEYNIPINLKVVGEEQEELND